MSSQNESKATFFQVQKWALKLPIPDRHKVVLIGLATFMEEKSQKAWPSLQSLAKRIGMDDVSVVALTIVELIDCDLLTPTKTDAHGRFRTGVVRIEVDQALPPDKNPLLLILLQEKALRLDIPDLDPTSRFVLHFISQHWDFTSRSSPVDYKRAHATRPWLHASAWARALMKLKKLGLIENVHRGNQHSLPRYSLDGLISASPAGDLSTVVLHPQTHEADPGTNPSEHESASPAGDLSTVVLHPQAHEADAGASPAGGVSKIPPYMNARAELLRNLEEEDKTDTDIFSSSRFDSSQFAAELIRELTDELQPDESLGPIIQIEATTGVKIDASWGSHWAEAYRRHRDAGRRSPLGIVFSELRFMAQANAVALVKPAPTAQREEIETITPRYSENMPDEADPQARDAWEAALVQIQRHVTRPNFETWLKGTVGMAQTADAFFIGCPTPSVAEMLESRMYSLIARAVATVVKEELEVEFEVYKQPTV